MLDFSRETWVNIGVSLVSIPVGLLGGWLINRHFQRRRAPVLALDRSRVEIITAETVASSGLTVLRTDQKPINVGLYVLRFYFWNWGNEPITMADVLEPIVLRFTDSATEIVDIRLLATSRRATQLSVQRLPGPASAREIRLDFKILERNDGGTVQVVYDGPRDSAMALSGTVVGCKLQFFGEGARFRPSTPVGVLEEAAERFLGPLARLGIVFMCGVAAYSEAQGLWRPPASMADGITRWIAVVTFSLMGLAIGALSLADIAWPTRGGYIPRGVVPVAPPSGTPKGGENVSAS